MAVIFFSFLPTTWFSCLGIQCRPKLTRDWQQHNRLVCQAEGTNFHNVSTSNRYKTSSIPWAFNRLLKGLHLSPSLVKNPPAMRETWVWFLGWGPPQSPSSFQTSVSVVIQQGRWCWFLRAVGNVGERMTPNALPENSRRARALGVGVDWQLIWVSLMQDLNLGAKFVIQGLTLRPRKPFSTVSYVESFD